MDIIFIKKKFDASFFASVSDYHISVSGQHTAGGL